MTTPVGSTPAAQGAGGPRERDVQAVAHELSVVFLTQLLQVMRRTVPDSGMLPKSPARDVYEGAFDRSVAEAMAVRDPLGLVHALGGSAAEGSLKYLQGYADIGSEPPLPATNPDPAGGLRR